MSFSAGCRTVEIPFPTLVLYPSTAAEQPERAGPFFLNVALNAPPAPGPFRLIVISHGSGGSHLVYRSLAEHLARAGFVVACPEHPGNNRNNNELAKDPRILSDRPSHVRTVLDWAFTDPSLAPHLVPDSAAIIGHSFGGYTGLVLAGGRPSLPTGPIPVTSDPRVKALVLLAPATPWFMSPGALLDVSVPILMLTAEHDPHTPPFHADIVRQGLPPGTPIEHRIIPNAGHFSFLTPFPPSIAKPGFAPATDPPGFDRPAFHTQLNRDIVAFLNLSFPA
jgi:predicted dienelactone hydrolase